MIDLPFNPITFIDKVNDEKYHPSTCRIKLLSKLFNFLLFITFLFMLSPVFRQIPYPTNVLLVIFQRANTHDPSVSRHRNCKSCFRADRAKRGKRGTLGGSNVREVYRKIFAKRMYTIFTFISSNFMDYRRERERGESSGLTRLIKR